MIKRYLFLVLVFPFLSLNAQQKRKDSLNPEVVNVISSYTPTISDATKIKKKPSVKILDRSKKKKMTYAIFSIPVASTFVPKKGKIKEIEIEDLSDFYNNYITLGFGNFLSPLAEIFINKNIQNEGNFGLYVKYFSSENSIDDTVLNSYFSNFESSVYFKKQAQNLDWKAVFNSERNVYNWYGLPNFFSNTIDIANIDEELRYNFAELNGNITFVDAYVDNSNLSTFFFTDPLTRN